MLICEDYEAKFSDLSRGESMCYFTGDLASDRNMRSRADDVGRWAMAMYCTKKAFLVQKKTPAAHVFQYIIQRR